MYVRTHSLHTASILNRRGVYLFYIAFANDFFFLRASGRDSRCNRDADGEPDLLDTPLHIHGVVGAYVRRESTCESRIGSVAWCGVVWQHLYLMDNLMCKQIYSSFIMYLYKYHRSIKDIGTSVPVSNS